MEQHTFRTRSVATQKQRTLHLLQHCQEMQDGLIRAQENNRQLLQRFQEAQGTLREMLALTAAMKTTRMEYEKHLVGIPQWRQHHQEDTQEKRNLNSAGHRGVSSPGQALPSHLSSDGSSQSAHVQPSWMMQPRTPLRPQDPSRAPPHLPSNLLQLHHQASSTLGLLRPPPCQKGPDQPWFWTTAVAGSPSGSEAQFSATEPPAESRQQSQTTSPPSSCRKSPGSRNSHSAQELDTQPVRLPCSAESSDSTTESSQVNKKKRGSPKHTLDRGHSSPEPVRLQVLVPPVQHTQFDQSAVEDSDELMNSQASSAVGTGADEARSSGSAGSSKEGRRALTNEGSDGGPLKVENGVGERNNEKNKDKGPRFEQTGKEESGSQSEGSGSVKIKTKNGYSRGRSEGGKEEVKDEERQDDPEESDENEVRDEEEQGKEEDIPIRMNTTDEEKNAGAEEEEQLESEGSDGVKDEDNRKLDLSSQKEDEEDESDASEDLSEEDEASDEDKKTQESTSDEEDEAEERKEAAAAAREEDESDSDDCIIPLQKSKPLHIIPEEASEDEDEEETKPDTSEEDSEFSDDMEDPPAPPRTPETREKEMKPEQKPKAFSDRMEIFQVETEEGSSHEDHHASDSDEFDHFFD